MKVLIYLVLFTFVGPNVLVSQNYSTEIAKREIVKKAYENKKMAQRKASTPRVAYKRRCQTNKCEHRRKLQKNRTKGRRMMCK